MDIFLPFIQGVAYDAIHTPCVCWMTEHEWYSLSHNLDKRVISNDITVVMTIAYSSTHGRVWLVPDRRHALSKSLECAAGTGLWGVKWTNMP